MNVLLPQADEPIELILKLTGETCNINCYYCYEKRKPYAQARYLDTASLVSLLSLLEPRPLSVHLLGGEPLLFGMERMRSIFAALRAYRGGIRVGVQTNGTLLSGEWLSFFSIEWPEIQIGISIDGPEELNGFRVDYRDNSTFIAVCDAMQRLHDHGLEAGIISVITRKSITSAPRLLDFISKFPAVRALNFAPCFDYRVTLKRVPKGNFISIQRLTSGKESPDWAITPEQYAEFLCSAYDHWTETFLYQRYSIEPFMSVIRKLLGRTPGSCHFSEQKCAYSVTLYPDGRIGTCDEIDMPLGLISEIQCLSDKEDFLRWKRNAALRTRVSRLLKVCDSCAYQSTCGGGCLATRLRYEGTEMEEEYCRYRSMIIDHINSSLSEKGVML